MREVANIPQGKARILIVDESAIMRRSLLRVLGDDYELVEQPGPGVMRIHMALTDVRESDVALDVFTTVVVPARLVQEARGIATGTQKFVGEAAVEIEFLDAESDEILAASMLADAMDDANVILECHPRLVNLMRHSFGDRIPVYGTRKVSDIVWLHAGLEFEQWNNVVNTTLFPSNEDDGSYTRDSEDVNFDGITFGATFAWGGDK